MARLKEFDPDAVLERALHLFWANGYEATSMADLVEHLGIGRASLYATYGNKRDLYLKALDRYSRRADGPIEIVSQPGPVLPAIRRLIDYYIGLAARERINRGCMIANAAIECGTTDPDVSRLVTRNWQAIEGALASALIRARAQGEIGDDKDPHALAQLLLVFLQGMVVVGKGDPDLDRLRTAGDQLLAMYA
jgi:TetR/AcrR family transcriptional regulator, transcriptional repressor for nem operon